MQELNSELVSRMIKQVIIRYVIFSLVGFGLGAASTYFYIKSNPEICTSTEIVEKN